MAQIIFVPPRTEFPEPPRPPHKEPPQAAHWPADQRGPNEDPGLVVGPAVDTVLLLSVDTAFAPGVIHAIGPQPGVAAPVGRFMFFSGRDSILSGEPESGAGAADHGHHGQPQMPGCPPFHKPPYDGPPNGGSRAFPPFDCPAPVPEPGFLTLLLLGAAMTALALRYGKGRINGWKDGESSDRGGRPPN